WTESLLRRAVGLAHHLEPQRLRPARAQPGHHRLPVRPRGPRSALSPHPAPPALAGQAAGRLPGDEPGRQLAANVRRPTRAWLVLLRSRAGAREIARIADERAVAARRPR